MLAAHPGDGRNEGVAGAFRSDLWDALPVGVLVIGRDDTLLYVNRQARRIYGLPSDGWQQAMDLIRFYHPDGRPYERGELPAKRVRSGGADAVEEPIEILRPDGTRATLNVSASAVPATGVEPPAVVATVQEAGRGVPSEDVTVRTRFLEVAAHELRNPMTSVKSVLGLAERWISAGEGSERVADLVKCALEEIDRLSSLLNDVLEAFQASASHLAYRSDAVDLGQVASAALRPFQLAGGACRFVSAVPARPVWVTGDARRLEDMLRNLLSNARKYSPDGGDVRVSVRAEAGEALVSVRDEGVGIPEDQLTAVFGPFVRAANPGDRDPGGLGLGLYISVGIVRQHGGRLWAENNHDRGASFHVALPLADFVGASGPAGGGTEVEQREDGPAASAG